MPFFFFLKIIRLLKYQRTWKIRAVLLFLYFLVHDPIMHFFHDFCFFFCWCVSPWCVLTCQHHSTSTIPRLLIGKKPEFVTLCHFSFFCFSFIFLILYINFSSVQNYLYLTCPFEGGNSPFFVISKRKKDQFLLSIVKNVIIASSLP